MFRLQARLSANVARLGREEQAARRRVPEAPSAESRADATAQHVREADAMTGVGAGKLEMSHTMGRATTLVMAIACGVAAANIYYNQPMLGIMEAAFPGKATVIETRANGNPARFRRWPFVAGAVGRPLRTAASDPDSIRSARAVAGRRC